ncbi:MAG: hypothetical protein KDD45_16445, partial [Bdellovibrionales bacterium]|nr:hypothetical protein [Bdellovibrionales bacterium]
MMDDLIEEIKNTNEEIESLLAYVESFQKVSKSDDYENLLEMIDKATLQLKSVNQMLDSLPDAIIENIEDNINEYQESIEDKFEQIESDTTDLLSEFKSDIQDQLKSFEDKALKEISSIESVISMEWLTEIHEKVSDLVDEISDVVNKCDDTVDRCETDIVDSFSQITDKLNE